MCARYTLYHSFADLQARFEYPDMLFDASPRYNIAPTDIAAVIVQDHARRRLMGFRWGLVPAWADDIRVGQKMINARAESLTERPAFRTALKTRRCIVPADGFYEWIATGKERQPLHIRLNGGTLFGMAGLWETWSPPGQPAIHSFAVITTAANELMAQFHTRMPAILHPVDEATWLDPACPTPETLLRPYDPAEMEAYKVDKQVNRVGYDDASCIVPVREMPTLDL